MNVIKGKATGITVNMGQQQVPFVIFVGEDGTSYAGPLLTIIKFGIDGKVDASSQPGVPEPVVQILVRAMEELKKVPEPGRIILA